VAVEIGATEVWRGELQWATKQPFSLQHAILTTISYTPIVQKKFEKKRE